jgi:hypothetical protein
MNTDGGRKPRGKAQAPPPRRVLVGRLVVEEDPGFDPRELAGPILLRGLDDQAGRFAVYATLHDKVITVISDNRMPLRVTLGAIAEAIMTAEPERARRRGG